MLLGNVGSSTMTDAKLAGKEAAIEAKIPVGICGELAGDPLALPLLTGLGMTKFSVSAFRVAGVKAEIRTLNTKKCAALARKILMLSSVEEVRKLLASLNQQT